MILAFDTATPATTAALCSPGCSLALEARDDPAPGARPAHATRLLPIVAELMERAQASWGDIDRLAVGIGPGTFTGLRIGIATARALARARELPLTGISTLRSLAINGMNDDRADGGVVLAVLDARRGEVFAAAWRSADLDATVPAVLEARALAPSALAEVALALGHGDAAGGPLPVLALGGGAVEFRAILEPSGVSIPDDDSGLHRVTAINHCRLAPALAALAPDEVRPEYLRIPDAEITRLAARSR